MEPNSPLHGLTDAEAKRLREMGGGNTPPPPITKPAGQIIRENVCTLFNLFNVLIAIALALVGAWSNLLFILIIALNTVIGIVQELHAKKLVEQIAVLTAPRAHTLRDGEIRELPVEELVLSVSFYTLNQNYNTDRFEQLETTLENPVAYCLNLEYNVNALTVFLDTVRGTPDAVETGEWGPDDYVGDNGETLPLHYKLYTYPQSLIPRCRNWSLTDQFDRIAELAARCQAEGVHLTVVLPPMADIVLTEVCEPFGIDTAMEQQVLPRLNAWAEQYGFALLDYEWTDRPDFDDDTQFYDGFHLDEVHGLPEWVDMLFAALA